MAHLCIGYHVAHICRLRPPQMTSQLVWSGKLRINIEPQQFTRGFHVMLSWEDSDDLFVVSIFFVFEIAA